MVLQSWNKLIKNGDFYSIIIKDYTRNRLIITKPGNQIMTNFDDTAELTKADKIINNSDMIQCNGHELSFKGIYSNISPDSDIYINIYALLKYNNKSFKIRTLFANDSTAKILSQDLYDKIERGAEKLILALEEENNLKEANE